MKTKLSPRRFLFAVCAFSFLIIPAYAVDMDSSEILPEIDNLMPAPNEETQDIMPRADTYWKALYNNVNIRSGPGTSYSSYGFIHSGQIVLWDTYNQQQYGQVFADGHYWMKIMVYTGVNSNVEGWVAADNLQKMNVK